MLPEVDGQWEVNLLLKDNTGIYHIKPPFWVVQDEIEWSTRNFDYWSCHGYLAHFAPATSEWQALGIHKPVLKTTLNICFQKCATHRVVSGVR